jgi:hypothetical protein
LTGLDSKAFLLPNGFLESGVKGIASLAKTQETLTCLTYSLFLVFPY